jgi:hypothetical protein
MKSKMLSTIIKELKQATFLPTQTPHVHIFTGKKLIFHGWIFKNTIIW